MTLLPLFETEAEYDRIRGDAALYDRAIETIATRHGLDGPRMKFPNGSTIVYAIGDRFVIKLFPPYGREHFATERLVLDHVAGKLAIRTPTIVATGELEGWPYIIMDRLPGGDLLDSWDLLDRGERLDLCARLGEAVAGLHALSTEGLEPIILDWGVFVEWQKAGCVERHRRCGVPERWLEQIPGYLASIDLRLEDEPRAVLLHTEIMRDHLLVDRGGDGWRLTGLIDFEPAMVGHPEYELASIGTMVTRGDAGLLRAYLLGYGYREEELTPELGARMMAYALLHRYSNLSWYMELMPMSESFTTLGDLERAWWSLW